MENSRATWEHDISVQLHADVTSLFYVAQERKCRGCEPGAGHGDGSSWNRFRQHRTPSLSYQLQFNVNSSKTLLFPKSINESVGLIRCRDNTTGVQIRGLSPARSKCRSTIWLHLQVVRATFGAVTQERTLWSSFVQDDAVSTPVLNMKKESCSVSMVIGTDCRLKAGTRTCSLSVVTDL